MQSIPVVGTYISFFIFGGEFPGDDFISRLYTVHVLLIPGILLGLITAHMLLLVYHKHTQWPGPGRTNNNVVGFPLLPVYAAKAGGFFFIVFGVTALMGALLQINPIWMYGPYNSSQVTAGSQPDWYMGWLEGALTHHARLGDPSLGLHDLVEHLRPGRRADGRAVRRARRLPVHRSVDHRRQARAPSARPSAQPADPYGLRRRRHHGVRPALARRRQRHPRDDLPPVAQRDHLDHAVRDLRRAR